MPRQGRSKKQSKAPGHKTLDRQREPTQSSELTGLPLFFKYTRKGLLIGTGGGVALMLFGLSVLPPQTFLQGALTSLVLVGIGSALGLVLSLQYYFTRPRQCPRCGAQMGRAYGGGYVTGPRARSEDRRIPDTRLVPRVNNKSSGVRYYYLCHTCDSEFLALEFPKDASRNK
jgi:hypothetical protein